MAGPVEVPLEAVASLGDPASLGHLLGRMELVLRRVRLAVEARRAVDPDPLDRFRGLHIPASQVDALLGDADALMPADMDSAALLEKLEAAADGAEAAGADLRLRRLRGAFQLDALEVELLLVALAPDLDRRFETLYAYLQDDVSRRRATIGLWLELCGIEPAAGAAWRKLAGSAPLMESRLILVEDRDRPFLSRSLRVPDRVAAFLLGDDRPEPAIANLVFEPPPADPGADSALARALTDGQRLAYVRERPGASPTAHALAALNVAELAALCVDLRRLRPDQDPGETAALLSREARLISGCLVAGPLEALSSRGAAAVQALTEAPGFKALWGSANWDPAWAREVPFCCETATLDPRGRAELWRANVDGEAAPGVDPALATAPFRLAPESIVRAARVAKVQARAAGRRVSEADLRAGARAQNAAGLELLAQRIEPSVRLSDLVLPPEALQQLQDLVVRARHRELVLGLWGMGGPASRRRGLTALFAGPSGTGKTMAAEVLAAEMGLDLYVVDLAGVVDKYVGETEKNLNRIFAEAESVNGVLLFDEADALFGKRSDVSDAHDRYANVEVAYLLQRMELFEGIAILATNLRANLDEAFSRRLDVMVDFPEPEEEDRLRLWRSCLGSSAPVAANLDLEFLARAFRLSGGNIRNIVVTAAYTAAEAGVPIGMAELVRATQREYRKLGRMVVESEFGAYFGLATSNGTRGADLGSSESA